MSCLTTSTTLDRLHDFGNARTWQRFASQVRPPIIKFSLRMGLSHTDADDVVQETLLTFATRYRQGAYDRSRGRLSQWLFGIAFRQIRSARRRLARRELQFPVDAGLWANVPDKVAAATTWRQEWELNLLERCLDRVRWEVESKTLRAFERVVRDQRSPAQAAQELGITVKAVYNAKHRVLKRIREYMMEASDNTLF